MLKATTRRVVAFLHFGHNEGAHDVMQDGSSRRTMKVIVTPQPGPGPHQAALASLCDAVGRTVAAYQPEGVTVREVVVMLDGGSREPAAADVAPMFVDVSVPGYGHGI